MSSIMKTVPILSICLKSMNLKAGTNEAHIFSVGANTLKKVFQREDGDSAFVVISGESGAGKTENAKYLLQYLIHHNVSSPDFDTSFLEKSLVHIFSVLEAFGNAPTTHNRNSSRFGKCVRVGYRDSARQIGGVNVNTFLLEKTRVLHLKHSPETCFHVFNSMNDMPVAERARLFVEAPQDALPLPPPPFVPWRELRGALTSLRVAPEDFELLLRTLSALRLLARLHFAASDEASSSPLLATPDNELRLSRIALLLGSRLEDLKRSVTQNKFSSNSRRDSVYIRSCSSAEAERRVETLMKFVYQLTFGWITSFCERHFGFNGQYSIGIIDLYGFESLFVNGFEQLCINFANERLQEFFVESFLKATIAEYESEGVAFDCSAPCLTEGPETSAMIGRGIFPLLEEECRMMRVNANAQRLAQRFDAELRARYPRALSSVSCGHPPEMLVRHFAGVVRYDLSEFLPLNVDRMPSDVFDFLAGSQAGRWLMSLRSAEGGDLQAAARRFKQRPAVCSQFQRNLDSLLEMLSNAKHVTYVRCLKPRSNAALMDTENEGNFETQLVQQQLVSSGVTSTVQVCRGASHSVRMPYEQFHSRFAPLLGASTPCPGPASPALFADLESSFLAQHSLPLTPTRSNRRSVRRRTCASEVGERRRVCGAILERAGVAPLSAQFGRSRLFLTPEQADRLEDALQQVFDRAALVLQNCARRWIQRRSRYNAAIVIQRYTRGWLVRRHLVTSSSDATDHQPPPLPPSDNVTEHQPPPLPPSGDATDHQPHPIPTERVEPEHQDFKHRRGGIISIRYIPTLPVTLRQCGPNRESLVRHRLLPYSHLRPLNSVPQVHASYKLSITNCL